MSRLQPTQAPPPALPAVFLLLALAWGAAACFALAALDGSALATRWSPSVLALVHAFTLGLLGNALFGALLQFVPAAIGGARIGFSAGIAIGLALNLGTVLLLLHFLGRAPAWPAAALLAMGVGGGALALLRSLAPAGARPLPVGLGASLLALLLTLGLGLWLLATRGGQLVGPRLLVVDVHALLGLSAWVFGVLLCVASLVGPMLQGLARWRPPVLPGLLLLNGLCLLLALALRLQQVPLAFAVMALPVLLAAGLHARQLVRAPWRRNLPLRAFFATGVAMLAIAAAGLVSAAPRFGLLLWGLGAGLTMLVLGMALEILAFLAWLDLQRRLGRGHRLPGLHQLQGDGWKWIAFGHAAAASLLLLPGLSAVDALRPSAAALLGVAHLLVLAMGLAAFARARAFARSR